MIKRIIFSIILIAVVMGIGAAIGDSYSVMVHDRMAVSQLEDSDENFVAMKSSERLMRFMPLVQIIVGGTVLYFIWSGYLKRKLKELENEDK